ncbi:MAG TPA: Minf_1886 family protein [Longimicrobiales bacterium]|nr:Minf_1886 family protein [Longimicrobiales bacterium]
MAQVEFADEILQQLQERDPRYDARAYLLVLSALNHVMEGLAERRHISGRELALGLRDVAIDRFGLMARPVLSHWGMHDTEDVGRIVFALVECGVLVKQTGDRIEDFQDVFDFREVFEDAYPWGAHLS